MILRGAFRIYNGCVIVLFYFVLFNLISCQQASTENDKQIEEVFSNANNFLEKSSQPNIQPYLDSALSNFVNISPQLSLKKYQLLARQYYYHTPDYTKALLYIDSMEQVMAYLPSQSCQNELVFTLLHKGRIAMAQKQFDDAFLYYYKAKLIIDESKDTCQAQKYSFTMAVLLFKQEAYKDAIGYFTESYSKGERCLKKDYEGFFKERLITPNNIALCYERMNMLDSALYYYQFGLQNLQSENVKQAISLVHLTKCSGVYYGNLGGLMLKLNKVELAKAYLNKSIEINYREDMDISDAILTKIKLAQLEVGLGEILNSKFLISSIQHDLETYPNIEAEIRLAGVQKDYFKQVGDFNEADNCQKRKEFLQDSLRREQNPVLIKRVFIKEFDAVKNKVDLANLKRDDKFKSLLLLGSLVTVFFSGLMILLFAFNRYRNKKYIAKLEELNSKLNATNQKLDDSLKSLEISYLENEKLTKAVAHDMRSPLVAVVGVLDVLCTEDLDEESRNSLLNMAKESSQKGLSFLDDVLKSKGNNTDNFQKSVVSIKTIIASSISVINQQAAQKNQQFVIDVEDVNVSVNEVKIWRVMNNLIGNAVKFSHQGDKIQITAQAVSNYLVISVKDYGIGIPEDIQDNLFDFFTKASRKGTDGEETHGLGLAISKQIIEAHGGKIWFESEINIGTTFFVQLPI